MEALYNKRVIACGRKGRSEGALEEDIERDRACARESTLSDLLLEIYTTLSAAPLEVLGVGGRAAEERTRYAMMGAPLAAMDAAKQEPETATA